MISLVNHCTVFLYMHTDIPQITGNIVHHVQTTLARQAFVLAFFV